MEEKEPQENVISDYVDEIEQIQIEGHELAVRKARNSLFWAAGLFFAGEMIGMYRAYQAFEPIILIIALIEAGIFVGLAFWTRQKPYTAVITGLCYFIGLIVASAVIYGMQEGSMGVLKALVGGIIVKIIIIVNLIRPLGDAKKLQQLKANQRNVLR